jgi:hypothetical protein
MYDHHNYGLMSTGSRGHAGESKDLAQIADEVIEYVSRRLLGADFVAEVGDYEFRRPPCFFERCRYLAPLRSWEHSPTAV